MEDHVSIAEIFYPGNAVQIELVNESGTKIVSKTIVRDLNENQLVLSVSKWDESFDQSFGNRVVLVCKLPDQSNDYVFATRFINYKLAPPVIIVSRPSITNFWKGRRFFRCEVNKVTLSYFKNNKEYKNNEVINLSSSGLFSTLNYEHQFKPGTELTCRISLPTMIDPFLFVAKVVRAQNEGIALQFQTPSPVLQSQITKYLYNCQQSLVRQGKLRLLA